MARKGYTDCPECGCEVRSDRLEKHIRNVHPKKAKDHGVSKKKAKKAKGLSAKRQELLETRKRRENLRRTVLITVVIIVISAIIVLAYFWGALFPPKGNPVAVMETSMGTIRFELYEEEVPNTVENFKKYVRANFYKGLIFHRVANLDAANPSSHVVQTGGFNPGMVRKEPIYPEIPLEIDDDLTHVDGAVAMARTPEPDTASSQFYICDGLHHFLDDAERQASGEGRGYAVFGQVISGMSVVRAIGKVPVGTVSGYENVPNDDITIKKLYLE